MAAKSLNRWSTEELERAVHSDNLNKMEKYEAQRILMDRDRALCELVCEAAWAQSVWL
jgi:hypothetical protein